MWSMAVFLAIVFPIYLGAVEPSGIENFHQVSPNLYRGAQPTIEGFRTLAKLGVKTVVDLRHTNAQARQEQKIVQELGMKFLSVPMTMRAPTDEQIAKVFGELNSGAGPVFVHCRGGRDRTGTVIACYRIAHDAWDSQKALVEAITDGMRKDRAMKRYVRQFRGSSAARESKESSQVMVNNKDATQD